MKILKLNLIVIAAKLYYPKILIMSEKTYNIFIKDRCIYHSLNESEFIKTWDMIEKFLSIVGNISKEDIRFEEIDIV